MPQPRRHYWLLTQLKVPKKVIISVITSGEYNT